MKLMNKGSKNYKGTGKSPSGSNVSYTSLVNDTLRHKIMFLDYEKY